MAKLCSIKSVNLFLAIGYAPSSYEKKSLREVSDRWRRGGRLCEAWWGHGNRGSLVYNVK